MPLVGWIDETMQRDDDQRVDGDYFVEALRAEFSDNAETQVDTAVEWGRYAELFAYDKDPADLSLED